VPHQDLLRLLAAHFGQLGQDFVGGHGDPPQEKNVE
jgi:hypothetical protein